MWITPPAVANGVVYVDSDKENLYALDAKTGVPLWSYPAGGNWCSPAVANGRVYIVSYAGVVYAFGLPNGRRTK
jgi:outer membrane protein assembly factor BamB